MTRPWSPGLPIWECIDPKLGGYAREHFEERAALIEFHGNGGPVSSEQLAYAWTVECLWYAKKISPAVLKKTNVIVQLQRAEFFAHDLVRQHALGMRP